MQRNTDAFSWKRGRDELEIKKSLSCKPAFLFFFNFFYSKDGLKSQFIALSDHIEKFCGTKFQNYYK